MAEGRARRHGRGWNGRLKRAALLVVASVLTAAAAGPTTSETLIAFYAPWDPASAASLSAHGGALDVVAPAWAFVTGPDHRITVTLDAAGHAALAALPHPPRLWLTVQNAAAGQWDGAGAGALIRDPAASATVLDRLEALAAGEHAAGLVIDLENLPAGSQPALDAFLTAARARCRRHGWTLAVAAPVGDPDWDLRRLGQVVDRVILMAYDEHWPGGAPGPIASDSWFRSSIAQAAAQLGPGQAIAGVAGYAYDWPAAGAATTLSVVQATQLAARNGATPVADPASGERHFSYAVAGVTHQVWMADADSVRRQRAIAAALGVRAVALWRLGSEDEAMWRSAPDGSAVR